MPLVQKIRSRVDAARSEKEALVAIADGLDQVMAMLLSPPKVDEWTGNPAAEHWAEARQWDDPEVHRAVARDFARESTAVQLAALRDQLGLTSDPEDVAALQARIRLLDEKGRPGFEERAGRRVERTEVDDSTSVDLPPVSIERQVERIKWAHEYELHQYLQPTGDMETDWTPELAGTAFAKGGPMWLYLGNRKAVMQMPVLARAWLVQDAEKDSPADAHELSRDILKSDESSDPDITTAAIAAMSGKV